VRSETETECRVEVGTENEMEMKCFGDQTDSVRGHAAHVCDASTVEVKQT
jgi:hypothetical protein